MGRALSKKPTPNTAANTFATTQRAQNTKDAKCKQDAPERLKEGKPLVERSDDE
jgi:hypothetical protein